MYRFKVVLLGEGRVGKTSILVRYVKGEYNDNETSTVSASYMDKKLNFGSESVHLSVWDTAGQERFHALGPIYYRDADGALLVYDITDGESFAKVQQWVRELRKIVGHDIVLAIAGNKIDLERQRAVAQDQAVSFSQAVGASHHLTSAKLNRGLDDVFTALATRMVKKRKESQNAAMLMDGRSGVGVPSTRQKLVILDDVEQEKKSCCS